MDEQQFALSNAFQGQTLTQINITNLQSGASTPILFGITAVNGLTSVPEPSAYMLALGTGGLLVALRRKLG